MNSCTRTTLGSGLALTVLFVCVLLASAELDVGSALGSRSAGPGAMRRRLAQALTPPPLCATNDARWFGLLPLLDADSAPLLAAADAAPNMTLLYVDRWYQSSNSPRILYIRSSVTLTKPLVLGTFMIVEISAGVTLTLAAQPYLPKRVVFTGSGKVRFAATGATKEFWVMPEWWDHPKDADDVSLAAINSACVTATCQVVLTRRMTLAQPWVITPNVIPWTGSVASMGPPDGKEFKTPGVIFRAGIYPSNRKFALPRLFSFSEAVHIEDVTNLDLYLHNQKYSKRGVVLAPRAGGRITNLTVEAAVVAQQNNLFTINPQGIGATLQNVFLRTVIFTKNQAGQQHIMTNFVGPAPTLLNVTIENNLVNGAPDVDALKRPLRNTPFILLKNSGTGSIDNLTYTQNAYNGAYPVEGHEVVSGKFNRLTSFFRFGKDMYGKMSWDGVGNTLGFGAFSRTSYRDTTMTSTYTLYMSPKAGAPLITQNSAPLVIPVDKMSPWKPGELRTFYTYHAFANGNADISIGPVNHVKRPPHQQRPNPGMVVENVVDQGKIQPYRVAITFRNIGTTTLTQSSFSTAKGFWNPLPQVRINIGSRRLVQGDSMRRLRA